MGFRICFLFLMVLAIVAGESANETSSCPTVYAPCDCKGKDVSVPMTLYLKYDPNREPVCIHLEDEPVEACRRIDCQSKLVSQAEDGTTTPAALRKARALPLPLTRSPTNLAFNTTTDPTSTRCNMPEVANAKVVCSEYSYLIECNITCRYGYGYDVGEYTIEGTEISCLFEENIWRPYKFQDCKPYIHCDIHDVKKVSGGVIGCNQPVMAPLYCDIQCDAYGDYEETAMQRYECISSGFGDSLPHCVQYLYSPKELINLSPCEQQATTEELIHLSLWKPKAATDEVIHLSFWEPQARAIYFNETTKWQQ